MTVRLIRSKDEINRIPTYIENLDKYIQGGIPEGHIVLMSGTPGAMKSSVCFNILYHEALQGKVGLYVSLEQSVASIISHIVNMDYDLSKVDLVIIEDLAKIDEAIAHINASKKGAVIFADVGAIRKQVKGMDLGPSGDWLNVLKNIVKKIKSKTHLHHFTLDSLSALYVLSKFEHPRTSLFHIYEFLRDNELTSFLISEMPLDKSKYGDFEVEDYLADTVILLELAERQRKVTRELTVVKMRSTNCTIDVWTLEYKNRKFQVLYGGQPPLL